MPTSIPKNRNRYKVAELKQQMKDKIGTDVVEFETESGDVFSFPHPMFYSAAIKKELRAVADDDTDSIIEILLGAEQYQAFVDAGGDPEDVQYVIAQVQEDTQDALAGRKRPTQS